ncbi:MAG TPA: hypothetical protein VGJ33_15230 [Candidatus Angelobacter sp.]|jgi:hypothetical protein
MSAAPSETLNNGLTTIADPVPANVLQEIKDRDKARVESFALANQLGNTTELNQEYSAAKLQLFASLLQPLNIDLRAVAEREKAITQDYNEKVTTNLHELLIIRRDKFVPQFNAPLTKFPLPTFSALEPAGFGYVPFSTPDAEVNIGNLINGFRYTGGPKMDKVNEERHEDFGAFGHFRLTPNLFPAPDSGVLTSVPRINLLGGMTASSPQSGLFLYDGVAAVGLFLAQTLWQTGFGQGQDGSTQKVLGHQESFGVAWPGLSLTNTGYSQNQPLPGMIDMPAVQIQASDLAESDLFADLEIRLKIYIQQAGALVWCDPLVDLNFFRWAFS